MAQKKQKEVKNNSYHTLNYLMKIDQAIRNGEYPNANKLNQKFGTEFRYIRTLQDDYGAPVEFDFKKNGYYYTDNTFYIQQVMLKEGELLTLSTILPLWVMSFAGGAKVLNPPELKDMVKKAAEEILKNN